MSVVSIILSTAGIMLTLVYLIRGRSILRSVQLPSACSHGARYGQWASNTLRRGHRRTPHIQQLWLTVRYTWEPITKGGVWGTSTKGKGWLNREEANNITEAIPPPRDHVGMWKWNTLHDLNSKLCQAALSSIFSCKQLPSAFCDIWDTQFSTDQPGLFGFSAHEAKEVFVKQLGKNQGIPKKQQVGFGIRSVCYVCRAI